MIPIIESEVVEKKQWLTKEDFVDTVAIAQSSPGVFAINLSVFIGYKMKKVTNNNRNIISIGIYFSIKIATESG